MDDDIHAIETVVKDHLDGLYEGGAKKLASVFHPSSQPTYEGGDALARMPRDESLRAVRERPSSKTLGLARHDHILQIDIAAPNGVRQTQVRVAAALLHDYLPFLKVEGKWQVAQQAFARARRTPPENHWYES